LKATAPLQALFLIGDVVKEILERLEQEPPETPAAFVGLL
jgi:hypothetical protein